LVYKANAKATVEERAKLLDIVDLTSTASIAGKHIKAMNATAKNAAVDKLAKTSKRNENKTAKDAVLAVTYEATCKAAFIKHLEEQKKEVLEIVHEKRKSIVKEQGFLATIKIGDWVDVESDYSPGLNSDRGIGCVFGWHLSFKPHKVYPSIFYRTLHDYLVHTAL